MSDRTNSNISLLQPAREPARSAQHSGAEQISCRYIVAGSQHKGMGCLPAVPQGSEPVGHRAASVIFLSVRPCSAAIIAEAGLPSRVAMAPIRDGWYLMAPINIIENFNINNTAVQRTINPSTLLDVSSVPNY